MHRDHVAVTRTPGRAGRRWAFVAAAALLALLTASCVASQVQTDGESPTAPAGAATSDEPSSASVTDPGAPDTEASAVGPVPQEHTVGVGARAWPEAVGSQDGVVQLVPEVIETRPHDGGAFTQGLLIENGRQFESTGQYGESSLREVDPVSGEVLRSIDVDADVFAEGLELVGNRLVQLTWKEQVAFSWDRDSFDLLDTYSYAGEGWGLCSDGQQFVMSDGSSSLTFRDIETFAPTTDVEVTLDGTPIEQLNELECVDGYVFANVWRTSSIVMIDPVSGAVVAHIDAQILTETAAAASDGIDVLNGIAYDEATDRFHVTGKYWPVLFVVRFVEA